MTSKTGLRCFAEEKSTSVLKLIDVNCVDKA